jgi:dihydrolipoamide dehydrogenase
MFQHVQAASAFGIEAGSPAINFAVAQKRKQEVVDQLFKGLTGLIKGRKITVKSGTGQLVGPGRVRILDGDDKGAEVEGRHVVLAAGSVPRTIPGFVVDGKSILTSDEFLDLEALPASCAVIGGGAIGCEFASVLVDLGVKVTIIETLPDIVAACDVDVRAALSRSFKKRGIEILCGVTLDGHKQKDDGTTELLLAGGQVIEVDATVLSVGRRPRTEDLIGDGVGVELTERGFVTTDPFMRTSLERVFAVGDIVEGTPQLAHVGFAEAIVAIDCILGERPVPVDYANVPWAIYSHPEIAFVGITETEAKVRGLDYVTKKDPFGGNSRARIIGETEGLVKVIAAKEPTGKAGQILGVHMVGPWVTEQLGQGYLAVNWEATVDEAAHYIQAHPSLSETFGETLLALTGRGLHVG